MTRSIFLIKQEEIVSLGNRITRLFYLNLMIDEANIWGKDKRLAAILFLNGSLFSSTYTDLISEFELLLKEYLKMDNKLSSKQFLKRLKRIIKANEFECNVHTPVNEIEAIRLERLSDNLLNKIGVTEIELSEISTNAISVFLSLKCIQVLDLISRIKDSCHLAAEDSEPKKLVVTNRNGNVPKAGHFSCLEDAVVSNRALERIFEILHKAQLIDPDTKFVNSPDKVMGYFINTLQEFFAKGYFSRKPSNEEYLSISENTFKLGTSIGTIKNKKSRIQKGSVNIPAFQLD